MGRKKVYEERIKENVFLPKEVFDKVNKDRGQTPMCKFLSQIVCEKYGTSNIGQIEGV